LLRQLRARKSTKKKTLMTGKKIHSRKQARLKILILDRQSRYYTRLPAAGGAVAP
jgi:hypothetical protein